MKKGSGIGLQLCGETNVSKGIMGAPMLAAGDKSGASVNGGGSFSSNELTIGWEEEKERSDSVVHASMMSHIMTAIVNFNK